MLRRSRLRFAASSPGNDIYTGGLPNLTAALNARGQAEDRGKWTNLDAKRQRGIPRRTRENMSSIKTLHESSAVLVLGRNRCNNFNSNQYLIVSKDTNEGVFVDMADDWPDDWVGFVNEAGIDTIRCVFLTHLHIDNIIGLAPFHRMMPHVKVAWNLADKYWLEKFPAACRRYCREDMVNALLPMQTLNLGPLPPTTSALMQQRGKSTREDTAFAAASHAANSTRNLNVLLSGSTSRSSSFMELGSLGLFYIASPGHSMGHMMLHIPQERLLFSGDLVSYDEVGRIDLPMALGSMMAQSLRMLETLPDNTVVMPGHGRLTTLARERRCNKALQRLYELMAAGKPIPSVGFGSGFL